MKWIYGKNYELRSEVAFQQRTSITRDFSHVATGPTKCKISGSTFQPLLQGRKLYALACARKTQYHDKRVIVAKHSVAILRRSTMRPLTVLLQKIHAEELMR